MVHGCMVYTERAETATVSRGTSHVKTKQRSKYTSSVAIVKTRYEKRHALTHLESQATNAQRVCSRAENSVTQKRASSPLPKQLHWLPIEQRIKYKIAGLCYQIIIVTAPQYLAELFQIYVPSRSLRSSSSQQQNGGHKVRPRSKRTEKVRGQKD